MHRAHLSEVQSNVVDGFFWRALDVEKRESASEVATKDPFVGQPLPLLDKIQHNYRVQVASGEVLKVGRNSTG
jgi:hypothetical protein